MMWGLLVDVEELETGLERGDAGDSGSRELLIKLTLCKRLVISLLIQIVIQVQVLSLPSIISSSGSSRLSMSSSLSDRMLSDTCSIVAQIFFDILTKIFYPMNTSGSEETPHWLCLLRMVVVYKLLCVAAHSMKS